ncbi:MAG: DUF123 domain-containing protein [Chloroflexi bacterium]|nr:DUF123 domain-containing protein [Chloroflexota bacterium]
MSVARVWVDGLPARPGAYWLALCLPRPAVVRAGPEPHRLWPAGLYLYAGQAHGPGGIRARLGRHLRGQGRGPWHIDALRAVAVPVAWGWTTHPSPEGRPWECVWAQAWAQQPWAFVPQPGFGAGDCHAGCAAHGLGVRLPCPPALARGPR